MSEGLSWKKWRIDPHLMNRIQWDEKEFDAVKEVFLSDWFGAGEVNKVFEKKITEFTGIKHALLTNSGSSAILVALKTLIHEGILRAGDLVIHPVSTFATSLSSSVDLGLVPVFVETKPYTYVADPEQVEKAIARYPEIKGMVLPHIIGNISDIERIVKALNGRFLIEDSCDSLGGYFNGRHTGSLADMAVFSFYGSHHITAGGGGGAIVTNNSRYAEIAHSITFWGRDFSQTGFLNRYKYKTLGTNSQMPAIQAAFGLAQMEKLPGFLKSRELQFKEMDLLFKNYDFFHLPVTFEKAQPSWFGYPLVTKSNTPFSREEFVQYLTESAIEIRPIMCGNVLTQDAFKNVRHVKLQENYPVGDEIEQRGMFIPCWGMPEDQKKYYYKTIREFLDRYKKGSVPHKLTF
ncbi:MAG: DegT/DnrJ/EryC1/StrS family aminotransferase [Nanoarchaeota archaeon]